MTAPPPAPVVSCVVIFFDAARFIDEAIRSVVAQKGCQDWELLLVDDGSTDASTAIARAWAARDPRIRYLEHEGHANKGMSASRNLGVREARAPVIAFLDSDDVWLPLMLARRLQALEEHPTADAVIGPTWSWHTWSDDAAVPDELVPVPRGLPARRVLAPPAVFAAVYGRSGYGDAPAICSLMVRRRALLSIGGSVTSFRSMFEDQVLYARVFLHLPLVLDDRPLALYRKHAASACAMAEAAGEYSPDGPNAAVDRFVAWLGAYVHEQFGPDSPEWQSFESGLSARRAGARQLGTQLRGLAGRLRRQLRRRVFGNGEPSQAVSPRR